MEVRLGTGMAGLIGLTATDMEIQDALGAVRWTYDDWVPHPVVRLTTNVPVAVQGEQGREVVRARWGFPVGPRPVGNCRDDKLTTSPLWSSMFGKSHALFAATGIYEMVKQDGQKQSYWFRRRDGRPIVMPGLVGTRTLKGEPRLCGAIVTTGPDPSFARFHPRQACSLEPHEMDAWMAGGEPAELRALLHPPEEPWEAVPIDDRIFAPGRREMEDLVQTGPPV